VTALQAHDEAQVSKHSLTLDALWGCYGEQSTMWFHRLGREPKDCQPMRFVRTLTGSPSRPFHTGGVARARGLLADFFDGDLPTGLFHPATVDADAQTTLLASLDTSMDGQAQGGLHRPGPLMAP
jgi:hypothetical protein